MNSIRRQLTRNLLLTLAALLYAGLIAIGATVWWVLADSFDAALWARALAVGALTEVEGGKVVFDFSDDFLRDYGGKKPRNYFEVWDDSGAVLTRSPSLGNADFASHGPGTPERPAFWNLTLPNGRPGRAIAFALAPTVTDAKPVPAAARQVRLVAAIDREDFNETLRDVFLGLAGCGLVLLGAVWFVVPRVLRRGLAPLDQLGDEVSRIDAASLGAQLSMVGLPTELRPVGERLNDLLARLAASFERERRFSADLAHELRTPLAELRSLAECALKWPDARDPATDREVLAISAQLETLVTRLLTLTRGERGQLPAEMTPVDPAQFVAEVWRQLAERATARKLQTDFAVATAAVPADPVLLRGILQNLFDNAVAYAPAGSTVRVTGEAVAGGYVLRCANPAGDLAPADVARLFERFWRKEAARSGGEHIGLGLSLARAFAVAMGWRLTAALDAEGWLVFSLETGEQ